MNESLRRIASQLLVSSGWCAVQRAISPRAGAIILYGHRVSGDNEGYLQGLKPDWLDEQLQYLTKHFEVISLSKLLECFEQNTPVPRNSAVLTFDDGFKDNLTNALPLLQKYRVPATIFLVTGSLTSGELPWSQRLGYMFQHTEASAVTGGPCKTAELPLNSAAERFEAYQFHKKQLIPMGREQREDYLSQLSKALKIVAPKDRMLTWDEAKEMQRQGIEFGAHTFSHPLLGKIAPDEAIWEIEKSRDDLKESLGVIRPSFCFPAGSWTQGLLNQIPALGLRSVFVPNRNIRVNNTLSTSLYSLSRMGLPNSSGATLEAEIDGPFHLVRRLSGKYSK